MFYRQVKNPLQKPLNMTRYLRNYFKLWFVAFVFGIFSFNPVIAETKLPIAFDPINIYLEFIPYPPPTQLPTLSWKIYSAKELLPMINKTAEKFRNLFGLFLCDSSIAHNLPVATAMFNNELQKLPSWSLDKKPVSVLLIADFLGNRTDECKKQSQTQFSLAISKAREANNIFPRTVEYIMLNDLFDGQSMWTVDLRLRYIYQAKHQITQEGTDYKLGILQSLGICTKGLETWFRPEIAPLLPIVDFIVLAWYPELSDYINGPEHTAKVYFERFQRCQMLIHEVSNSTEVAFFTRWSSRLGNGKSNYTNQVNFWRRLNEWALAYNTKMLLYEAFDNPNADLFNLEAGYGWWERDPSDPDTSKYKDKETLTLEEANPDQKISTFSLTVYIGSLSAAAFIIIWILLIYFILHKRKIRQLLSDEEIKTFRDKQNDSEIKFNELLLQSFTISENNWLGSGEFGVVCHGTVTINQKITAVAVKQTKQPCSAVALRSLLSELTVLAAIGSHNNIIGIVGACTLDIRKNKLILFFELCENGTLENYLRNKDEVDQSLLKELLRWSYETCCGLQYIATKNIVHMDIATRNVLLSSNLTAKISDFGLSHRLYNYRMYTKKNQEPLPWRWMSPESLQRSQFTEKSDVWSFGITLWEIFSLGEIPYAVLRWNNNFASVLVAGLRLAKPRFNHEDVYEKVIRPCWDLVPEARPTFEELKSILEETANYQDTREQ